VLNLNDTETSQTSWGLEQDRERGLSLSGDLVVKEKSVAKKGLGYAVFATCVWFFVCGYMFYSS